MCRGQCVRWFRLKRKINLDLDVGLCASSLRTLIDSGRSHQQADHAPFNKMGSKLWQRKIAFAGRGRGRGGGADGGEERGGAGSMLEMRTIASGGGFVDPHY